MADNLTADLASLEFANDAFYQAFAAADLAAMEGVWAEQPTVFCCHPGWPPLTSRTEVMASWRDILGGAGPVPVACAAPRPAILGEVGLVCCYERFSNQHLVATNLFIRAGDRWRMIHHHAGPLARVPEEIAAADNPSRH
ncbi:MAG TPA: nuclear transport factor 2 family protein [Candidatus Binatia bacterium]|nr:nuclear transport factor 2 family protein [Candidatus Binatia bacterium]